MFAHLSLCSGIGGLDLAAEWAGFKTVAQCEIDEYASKVLAKNFKGVPNLHDIRTVTNKRLAEFGIDGREITVISAGFPCQPYSLAGKGLGDRDERDLWGEVARVLTEIKPKWFVGENTPGLFTRQNQRFFRRVLDDLTALGYRVGWGIWGACDVGAPHKRDRVFIMAHADGERRYIYQSYRNAACQQVGKRKNQTEASFGAGSICRNFSDASIERQYSSAIQREKFEKGRDEKDTWRVQESGLQSERICSCVFDAAGKREYVGWEWWETEPDVGRVAHGVSARVDRLKCLGNAVVPQQAYPIFKAIAEHETKAQHERQAEKTLDMAQERSAQ